MANNFDLSRLFDMYAVCPRPGRWIVGYRTMGLIVAAANPGSRSRSWEHPRSNPALMGLPVTVVEDDEVLKLEPLADPYESVL